MARTIAVIGNPNCGKTTLFNALTGARQHVGNWSGVTVERKEGSFILNDKPITLVDLPGTYSLDVSSSEISLDERIARDYALSGEADLILNIIDASNLERNLYLTAQLLEMNVPVLVVLNMTDIAKRNGNTVDEKALEKQLGCPVVSMNATAKYATAPLLTKLQDYFHGQSEPLLTPNPVCYSSEIEQAISTVATAGSLPTHIDSRWLSLRLLEQDPTMLVQVSEQVATQAKQLAEHLQKPQALVTQLATARYQYASHIAKKVIKKQGVASSSLTEKIDNLVLNRFLGLPLFFAAMYFMFTIAVNVGGAFIDFFDIATGAILVDGVGQLLTLVNAPQWLIALLADGLGGGIQLVATFIPVIGFLYLCLAILEDSGYMARAAFVMDRLMRAIGLPGKAFVPLIVGFGCNVPAVMASRTLETQKDRLLTIAMAPFMSCGARLSVYALFVAAFFTENGANLVFALYLLGIVMAVATGFLLKSTLFNATLTPFIMELPAYHRPSVKNVLYKAWERLKSFSLRAGKTIVIVFVALKIVSSIGMDGSFGNDNTDNSVLSEISKTATPIFAPMGLKEENWPATVGIITGIFAKEAVVGTLDSLYSSLDGQNSEAAPATIGEQLQEAFASIPANLSDVMANLGDPLGLSAADVHDQTQAAVDQDVKLSTYTKMDVLFGSTLAAFSYLVFVLLYTPCVAVMGAIYREAGMRWTLFVSGYATGLAYIAATAIYQVGQLSTNPSFAISWLIGCVVVIVLSVMAMRYYGKKAAQNSLVIPVVNIQ